MFTTTETVVDNLTTKDDDTLKMRALAAVAFRAEVEIRGARTSAGRSVRLPSSVFCTVSALPAALTLRCTHSMPLDGRPT